MTTSLINKIELLIKREKTTPERKKEEPSKSSSEILSELFGAFNADPPKIEEISTKKSKKSKKKHRKEKKKRSRSSSSSSSDDSEYSHRRKKRKKSKAKRQRSRTPSTPKLPYRSPTIKSEPVSVHVKKEPTVKSENVKVKKDTIKEPSSKVEGVKVKKDTIKEPSSKVEDVKVKKDTIKEPRGKIEDVKVKKETTKEPTVKIVDVKVKKETIKEPTVKVVDVKVKQETIKEPTVKIEDVKVKKETIKESNDPGLDTTPERPPFFEIKEKCDISKPVPKIDATLIPMPDSPKDVKLEPGDLRQRLDGKKSESEAEKSKGKIQIKNLKFSTVFEETVKKAEEEARKRAEKYEEGEYTDSSSESVKEVVVNSQFPKTSDPGGLKKAAEDCKVSEEQKSQEQAINQASNLKKSKKSESSHKSSKHDKSKSKRSSSRSRRSKSRSVSKKHRHHSSSKSHRSRSRHRSSSRSRRRSKSRSRIYSRHHSPRYRSRRSRSPTGVKLADSEKKRLLEVARRNAINMLKNGAVPAGAAALPPHTRNQVMAAIQSGGKSVDELTDFCKNLSKKEALGELSSVSSHDEGMSENEDTIAFHHPFLVKEKAPIIMNIRGGAPLPIKSSSLLVANKEELRLQFPVSSGSQHREKASEWRPVSPKKDMQVAKLNSKHTATSSAPKAIESSTPDSATKSAPLALPAPPAPVPAPEPTSPHTPPSYFDTFSTSTQQTTAPLALPAPGPQAYPPGVEPPKVDVAKVVSQKLLMIRKEQEQNELTSTTGVSDFGWTKESCSTLGQFTGSTGAQILTPRELASGTQAWAKKDQLTRAAPVEGGMGMHLLQKMGWTPGRGLGKEGTGTLQPLLLEVKLDTKGLQAKEEVSSRSSRGMKPQRARGLGRGGGGGGSGGVTLVAGGKHPVSLLGEYCSKQKLGPPEYNLCFECGPDHKKNFLFKVRVAGVEYQPAVASQNKKQAKADAAQLALQKLGILI